MIQMMLKQKKEDVSDEDINDYSQSLAGDTTPADDTLEDIFPEEELGSEEGSEELSDEDIADVPDYNKEDMGPRDFDTEDGLPNLDAADEEYPEEDMDDEFAPTDEEDVNNDFSDEDFVNPDELPNEEIEGAEDFDDSDEEFDKRFDNHADEIMDDFDEGNEDIETEETGESDVNIDTDESKVTGIYFDENVKTGTILKSGTISIAEPMVSPDGNKYVATKNIKFYIDDNNRAILNNEDISAELYNKALVAIENNPKFDEVIKNGEDGMSSEESGIYVEDDTYPTEAPTDEEYTDEIDIPGGNNEMSVDDFVEIPTYKDGETDIELPADDVEFEELEKVRKSSSKKTLKF